MSPSQECGQQEVGAQGIKYEESSAVISGVTSTYLPGVQESTVALCTAVCNHAVGEWRGNGVPEKEASVSRVRYGAICNQITDPQEEKYV